MLQITIPAGEEFDELTNTFMNATKECTLQLEHSLVSLSKWEAIWGKPFLTKEIKTHEETIDYIRCMTLTQNVDPNVYKYINSKNIGVVKQYIEAPMTATTFSKDTHKAINRDIVTAEIIYYWMIVLNVPFECQKWHLNRLLTLINVCNVKNQSQTKKMTPAEVYTQNRTINEARRRALNTKG